MQISHLLYLPYPLPLYLISCHPLVPFSWGFHCDGREEKFFTLVFEYKINKFFHLVLSNKTQQFWEKSNDNIRVHCISTCEFSSVEMLSSGPLLSISPSMSSTISSFCIRRYCRWSSLRTASFVLWIRSRITLPALGLVKNICWRGKKKQIEITSKLKNFLLFCIQDVWKNNTL